MHIREGKAMSDGFTLYGSPHSLYTYKVALMLRLSAAPFSFRYVSFQRGMHRTPEFLAMSRWGPVLRHGERTMVQSATILEYLADTLGKFSGDRTTVREWLCWEADRLTPPAFNAYGVRLGEQKLLPLSWHPEVAAYYRRNGEAAWDVLDKHLDGRDFLVGQSPTIADIACYAAASFARMGSIDLSAWPRVAAWAARIDALPFCQAPLNLLPMADAEFTP
jgi:glutathione S-transferase